MNDKTCENITPAFTGQIFRDHQLLQIAMPIGGIGAGCICLGGRGELMDFSIRHKPAFNARPDGWNIWDAGFAVLHINGDKPDTRLIEGPLPREFIYNQGLRAQGYRLGGYEGLPRFSHTEFRSYYPFGEVRIDDTEIPIEVRLTGWNPLIPNDDKNSSIPCAILEYELANTSGHPVEYEFSYHLSHLAGDNQNEKTTRNRIIPNAGIYMYNQAQPNAELFGSASLSVIGHEPVIKAMWLRTGWFDWLSALWRELKTGTFRPNSGNTDRALGGHNGGSILLKGRLDPGEKITYPVIITWYFPNVYFDAGAIPPAADTNGALPENTQEAQPKWHPYYATQWENAEDVAAYVRDHYESLRARTLAFTDALFSSTLPPTALDAISSNLAILKSPTILRQANGNIWGWEGCFCDHGSCHGTCTHVWNYAQSLAHLFPQLERGLRDMEYRRSMNEEGHVNFRSALPDGPVKHDFHPAADGQLGGIMKLYRDWQICGDDQWLKGLYPLAKRSLNYCINRWDPDRRGALFEPHHNTYDIEFWGPDGMCTSVYTGALYAIAEMAQATGDTDEQIYRELAEKSAAYMDRELFNGDYYQQKVLWNELRDKSFSGKIADEADSDAEEIRILREEGPKYQYGSGCLSDGIIGAWMSDLYGIGTSLNSEHITSSLRNIYNYNFKKDLWHHACTQRPGYAIGHEPGLVVCTWPKGGHPTLPFVYCDEVFTGIEYQVASHLILRGMVSEGMAIVEALRSRYDGRTRNPFNEYECGSYYARAMASYALLQSLSGLRYSARTQVLELCPYTKKRPFACFFSVNGAFGTVQLTPESLKVRVIEGTLNIKAVKMASHSKEQKITWHASIHAGERRNLAIYPHD